MSLLPRINKKEIEKRTDLEIQKGQFKIYFMEYYSILKLIGDILVGLFFIIGALLNFWEGMQTLSKISYLIGSLSFSIRPTLNIIRRTWIFNGKQKDKNSKSKK